MRPSPKVDRSEHDHKKYQRGNCLHKVSLKESLEKKRSLLLYSLKVSVNFYFLLPSLAATIDFDNANLDWDSTTSIHPLDGM